MRSPIRSGLLGGLLGSGLLDFTIGAIAQLGERVNGIHEVGGSIPPGSTNPFNDLASSPNGSHKASKHIVGTEQRFRLASTRVPVFAAGGAHAPGRDTVEPHFSAVWLANCALRAHEDDPRPEAPVKTEQGRKSPADRAKHAAAAVWAVFQETLIDIAEVVEMRRKLALQGGTGQVGGAGLQILTVFAHDIAPGHPRLFRGADAQPRPGREP